MLSRKELKILTENELQLVVGGIIKKNICDLENTVELPDEVIARINKDCLRVPEKNWTGFLYNKIIFAFKFITAAAVMVYSVYKCLRVLRRG